VGNADLFQRWKDYEKSRRLKFASVMKERRRLKALHDKPSTPPSINENSTAASASLKQSKRLSPPSQMSGRLTLGGGYGSSNLTQLKRMQHEAKDPKELLELERQKLQQIIEEEVCVFILYNKCGVARPAEGPPQSRVRET
jgi:hypothetical protein